MPSSILITGASSGIGRAVALRLSHWDGCLVLTGRSSQRLEITKSQVEGAGGRAELYPCDLTQPAAVEGLVSFAEDQAPLHGVVLSAGDAGFGQVLEQPPEDWRRILDINLLAPYQLSRLALSRMVPRKKGHIIFINSVAGLKSFPGSSAYVATKHGLRGLAETIRLEAREHQVKVTSLFPGATDTEWWDKLDGNFPRDRMLRADDVAAAVEFALTFSEHGVVEELVIRHQKGDF